MPRVREMMLDLGELNENRGLSAMKLQFVGLLSTANQSKVIMSGVSLGLPLRVVSMIG
jgi:hypothetical protein